MLTTDEIICMQWFLYLTQPIGRILPNRVNSPVIARSFLTSFFMARDNKDVIMVQPALGSSIGVALKGT